MEKDIFIREIEAHFDLMYRVAFTILRNEEDSKDALQEAAMKAWEKKYTLRDNNSFKTWIIIILKNTCYNMLRKRKRFVPIDSVQAPSIPPPDPSLSIALFSIPEKLRLPLMLAYSEGLTYQEIARVLNIPLTTVCGRINMGKKQLKKELEWE